MDPGLGGPCALMGIRTWVSGFRFVEVSNSFEACPISAFEVSIDANERSISVLQPSTALKSHWYLMNE